MTATPPPAAAGDHARAWLPALLGALALYGASFGPVAGHWGLLVKMPRPLQWFYLPFMLLRDHPRLGAAIENYVDRFR